jgi:uncharacterized protein YoxC
MLLLLRNEWILRLALSIIIAIIIIVILVFLIYESSKLSHYVNTVHPYNHYSNWID